MTAIDYQKLYDAEFDQRNKLRDAVGLPVAVLTLLGGALGTMRDSLVAEDSLLWQAFIGTFVSALCCFVAAAYALIRSYHGHEYEGVPTALELKAYHDQLIVWHTHNSSTPAAADAEFAAYLEDALAHATHRNAEVNAVKSVYLFSANTAIIICGVFTATAFVSHAVLQEHKPAPVYHVEVVERADRTHLKGDTRSGKPTKEGRAKGSATATNGKTKATAPKDHQRRPNP